MSLNPFGTGQCLSTVGLAVESSADVGLNPFGTGQCLPTTIMSQFKLGSTSSQSLWNRAVSSDAGKFYNANPELVVSIPLEQGSVFRQRKGQFPKSLARLNPFGTGQCLPTAVVF